MLWSMLLLVLISPKLVSLINLTVVKNVTTYTNVTSATIIITNASASTIIDNLNSSAYVSSNLCSNSDEIRCLFSRECIPATWRCDQTVDCEDNSDEWPHYSEDFLDSMQQQQLPLTTLEPYLWCQQCGRSHFRCNQTGECIPRGWLCDGQFDCSELPTDNADADHEHWPNIGVPFDKSDEVNEICDNIEKLKFVESEEEFNETEDKVSRLILSATRPHLLLHNKTHLTKLIGAFYENISMGNVMKFQDNSNSAIEDEPVWVSKTSDSRLCRLIRSNHTIQCHSMVMLLTNQIRPSSVPPASREKNYRLPQFIEAQSIKHLALDWLTLNWYLLDAKSELLYMCNAGLETCAVVLDHRVMRGPLAFDLDAAEGWMFLSLRGDGNTMAGLATGHAPVILRAQLNGIEVTPIVDIRLVEPAMMSIDLQMRRLYWIDVYLSKC